MCASRVATCVSLGACITMVAAYYNNSDRLLMVVNVANGIVLIRIVRVLRLLKDVQDSRARSFSSTPHDHQSARTPMARVLDVLSRLSQHLEASDLLVELVTRDEVKWVMSVIRDGKLRTASIAAIDKADQQYVAEVASDSVAFAPRSVIFSFIDIPGSPPFFFNKYFILTQFVISTQTEELMDVLSQRHAQCFARHPNHISRFLVQISRRLDSLTTCWSSGLTHIGTVGISMFLNWMNEATDSHCSRLVCIWFTISDYWRNF
jgi:hypothetical protein